MLHATLSLVFGLAAAACFAVHMPLAGCTLLPTAAYFFLTADEDDEDDEDDDEE